MPRGERETAELWVERPGPYEWRPGPNVVWLSPREMRQLYPDLVRPRPRFCGQEWPLQACERADV